MMHEQGYGEWFRDGLLNPTLTKPPVKPINHRKRIMIAEPLSMRLMRGTKTRQGRVNNMGHFYEVVDGICEPRYFVPNKSKGGNRPTTVTDARKGGYLPSPTTVLAILAKPSLLDWIIKTAVHAVVTSPDRDGENLDAKIARVLDDEKQHEEERDAAADLGTQIHDALQYALGWGNMSRLHWNS